MSLEEIDGKSLAAAIINEKGKVTWIIGDDISLEQNKVMQKLMVAENASIVLSIFLNLEILFNICYFEIRELFKKGK